MIPITRPYFGTEETEAVQNVIASGWVTQGPKVAEFERAVADYCGAVDAVAVTSCTSALHLALQILEVGPGDEVICPSMSFIAGANAICHTGAMPVFADVDPKTFNLDPASAEAAISPKTKAIMVVHQIGLPADIDQFLALGDKYGVQILEDAAPAIGSCYRGKPIGAHSEMACFSFHPRKVLTTGEGGMITTKNQRFADRLRVLRHHGMSISDTERHHSAQVMIEEYVCIGYNYRMTDIQAAIGLEQMKKLDWIIEQRQRFAQRYTNALQQISWLVPPFVPDYAQPNFQSYAVCLSPDTPLTRDVVMQRLLDKGISTRRGVMLAHREPPYREIALRVPLKRSERVSQESLLLPLFPDMTESIQDSVIGALAAMEEMA